MHNLAPLAGTIAILALATIGLILVVRVLATLLARL